MTNERDWYDAKSEFRTAMAMAKERVRTAEAERDDARAEVKRLRAAIERAVVSAGCDDIAGDDPRCCPEVYGVNENDWCRLNRVLSEERDAASALVKQFRSVLLGLSTIIGSDGLCWCHSERDTHADYCKAARELIRVQMNMEKK